MTDMQTQNYEGFIAANRSRINRYLNRILWLFVITGPGLFLGVRAGYFPNVPYTTCFGISFLVAALAGVHMLLIRRKPDARFTSAFALAAGDFLLVYLAANHVSLRLSWFLVPLLSILFCDTVLYFAALGLTFVLMTATTWFTAPYYVSVHTAFESAASYFFGAMGGLAIEMLLMAVSGYIIVRLSSNYYERIFRQYELLREKEKSEQEKMEILDSMAEIYDNVNLISFVENTEMSLRDSEHKKFGIDMAAQTHTLMNQRIREQVMPDQLDDFLAFTNITTVKDRLANRKIISGDFIDVVAGWFRAQYITVKNGPEGKPDVVIYTTRNVDEEKRREEHLIRLSMTDEMTRLYNRRCYEEDLAEYRSGPLAGDFVLFSVDVNGLKTLNDTKGHAAGDELIKGAADCLALSIRQGGKVYRTGGDEFIAIVHTDAPERLRGEIRKRADGWHGAYTDEITLSIGYAASGDHPGATVDELEHLADTDMYAEKEAYYRAKGTGGRRV